MKKIITLVILMILTMSVVVFAALNGTMKLTADKKELKAGDEITFTLAIDNISQVTGINAIQGTIEYDKNVFEAITTDNEELTKVKEDKNGWSIELNPNNNMFAGTNNGVKTGDIFSLKLKVKENVTLKETTVWVKEIIATDLNSEKITVSDVFATIKPEGNSGNNVVNIITNNTVNKIEKNIVDNTVNPNVLPKTGISPIVIFAIAAIAIIATVSIIRYKNIMK